MIATYSYELDNPYCRINQRQEMIDLDLFKKYLDSIYIKRKSEQNRIISFYKVGVKEHKRTHYLVQALNDYPTETIDKITTYVVNTSVRNAINKEL